MKKFLLCLILGSSLAHADVPAAAPATAPAEQLGRDLGRGLAYFRLHTLPADLPAATARRGAAVLDLRYTRGESGATVALGDWLKSHSSSTTPVFVLLNADTAPAVLAYFTSHDPVAGLVTLGATAGSGFVPDITLKIAPAAERAAYDALEHGTPLETLLTDPANKARHDEASIAQERAASAEDATSPDTDLAEPGDAVPPATPPAPVIDYTLLRAVHLHRALLALRKL